jgi:hypothetical protein
MMPNNFWLRKLVSPSGVGLCLILLFMPFVGVACGPVEVEISGWDMAVGGEPAVTPADPSNSGESIPVQPLMVIAVVLMVAAVVVAPKIRDSRRRAMLGADLTGLAALTLSVNEIVIMDRLASEVSGSEGFAISQAKEIVNTRAGFWVTLALVTAVFVWNLFELAMIRRQPTTARQFHQDWHQFPQHQPPGPGVDPSQNPPQQWPPNHPEQN